MIAFTETIVPGAICGSVMCGSLAGCVEGALWAWGPSRGVASRAGRGAGSEKASSVDRRDRANVSYRPPIGRLTVDETWFDDKQQMVTGGKGVINGPLQPGETKIIETNLKSEI